MRQFAGFLAALLALSPIVTACGGGGGGGGDAAPTTIYVRESGDDANSGATPEDALRSLARATQGATGGQTIIVGPGAYQVPSDMPTGFVEVEDVPGGSPLTILADPTGAMTGDRADDVIVDANGAAFAFRISRSTNVVIDGFRIRRARGENGAAIQVRSDSSTITIRNCAITQSRDGIRIESSYALVFNNVIFANQTRGVHVASGSARILQNTIVDNGSRGVSVASAPGGVQVRNNILQDNGNRNIEVGSDSLDAYDGDFNLVFSAGIDAADTYSPSTIRGDNDVAADALFVNQRRDDYRLQSTSPAIDAGDGSLEPLLLSDLFTQSTTEDGENDTPPIDLGRHFR